MSRHPLVPIAAVAFALALPGCGLFGSPRAPVSLPVPQQSTTVGPGDVFEVFVFGEPNLPKEYRVQPDGSIDFPFIERVPVEGLEPQEIVTRLKERLVKAKILREPQLSLMVKQYNSKRISVIGQVTKPGTVPWIEGMKLVDALSQAGWFTSLSDSNHVIVTRYVSRERTVTAIVNVEAITDGKQNDIPLQAGDTIKVEAKVF
jgi:polysaccharide export outer membrane protein